MFGLKRLRFVDIGTGLSMMIGTAGLLVTSALHAADPGCCVPAPCRPTIQGGGCCDKLFEDAGDKLRNLNAGCTSCAPTGCAPTGNCCDKIYADAADKLKNLNGGCCAPATGCAPAASVCNPDAVFNGCNGGCNGGGRHGCGLLGGELGEPHLLIDAFKDDCGNNHFKDNGWVLGGHMQYGYQNNPDGAFAGNGPFISQKEYDRFALNQGYLFVGKVANGSDGLGFGFRTDLMYGLDGNEGQAFGNINPGHYDYLHGWDHGSYEWALPQLYGEVAYKDLSVKLGHFYTPIGYEVIPSTGNFFLSRQLTFYNSEPFTHTGALGTYKASDKLSVLAGWTLGMDTGFYQYENGNSGLAGFTYTVNENTSVIYAMTAGNLGWRGNGAINSAILTRKWCDKFSTVHQFDILGTDLRVAGTPADFITDGIARDSIGLINYAFYDVSSRVKAGVRQEWYKADSVSYYTLTYGVNVKPCANLVVRPEVRHMWSPGNDLTYFGPDYADSLFNQTVFGIDAIMTF